MALVRYTLKQPFLPKDSKQESMKSIVERFHQKMNEMMFDIYYLINMTWKRREYRESLPNATFGSGKNSHKPLLKLAKYLANAFFGPNYFITGIWL